MRERKRKVELSQLGLHSALQVAGVFRYGINFDILHLKFIFIYFTYIIINYLIVIN